MAFVGKNSVNDKHVTENQDYTQKISGDRKKWQEIEYRFYGDQWEQFAALLAKRSQEIHMLNYFIGAHLDFANKRMTFRNGFGFNVWMEKNAAFFPKWTFDLSVKRIKLPRSSKDEDSLTFVVNGRPAEEIWEEHFVGVSEMADAA